MMNARNWTSVTEFLLFGLTEDPKLQIPLFVIFLIVYALTLIGNLGIITLVWVDPHLHTPMYYFLSNLSFSDLCYSSVITPKMLVNFLTERKSISFYGCAIQLYFFGLFVGTECFLVTVMAYDRYVAICKPLLYSVIVNKEARVLLVAAAYSGGVLTSAIHTSFTFRLPFCDSNEILHFFCDIPPLLKLSCADTYISEVVMFLLSSSLGSVSVVVIIISYTYILSAILKIQSGTGRSKAFSTCASHLAVVFLFFGTAIFMYVRPISSYSVDQDKVVSVFYTVIIPMLNPLIYSLRNKEVKDALARSLIQKNTHY
ncbi:olfactory receptor 5AP2-like [Lissotriton helveticus]